MNLAAVLDSLMPPGAEWSLDGNTLDGITIHTPGIATPTQEECEAEWQTLRPRLAASIADRREKNRTRASRIAKVRSDAAAANSMPALRAQVTQLIDIMLEIVEP